MPIPLGLCDYSVYLPVFWLNYWERFLNTLFCGSLWPPLVYTLYTSLFFFPLVVAIQTVLHGPDVTER